MIAQKMSEAVILVDEWWELTHQDSINTLDRVFLKYEDLRRAIRHAIIALLLVVTCVYAYAIEKSDPSDSVPVSARIIKKAKKMIFYVH